MFLMQCEIALQATREGGRLVAQAVICADALSAPGLEVTPRQMLGYVLLSFLEGIDHRVSPSRGNLCACTVTQ